MSHTEWPVCPWDGGVAHGRGSFATGGTVGHCPVGGGWWGCGLFGRAPTSNQSFGFWRVCQSTKLHGFARRVWTTTWSDVRVWRGAAWLAVLRVLFPWIPLLEHCSAGPVVGRGPSSLAFSLWPRSWWRVVWWSCKSRVRAAAITVPDHRLGETSAAFGGDWSQLPLWRSIGLLGASQNGMPHSPGGCELEQ